MIQSANFLNDILKQVLIVMYNLFTKSWNTHSGTCMEIDIENTVLWIWEVYLWLNHKCHNFYVCKYLSSFKNFYGQPCTNPHCAILKCVELAKLMFCESISTSVWSFCFGWGKPMGNNLENKSSPNLNMLQNENQKFEQQWVAKQESNIGDRDMRPKTDESINKIHMTEYYY